MFQVDEAGKEIEEVDNEENLVQKFVEYIKVRRLNMRILIKNYS